MLKIKSIKLITNTINNILAMPDYKNFKYDPMRVYTILTTKLFSDFEKINKKVKPILKTSKMWVYAIYCSESMDLYQYDKDLETAMAIIVSNELKKSNITTYKHVLVITINELLRRILLLLNEKSAHKANITYIKDMLAMI
jgi:hypothetical protein